MPPSVRCCGSLEPDWSITLIERLDGAAAESSDPWNNAGTGHSALCELNYTPERPDGSIDIAKAVHGQRAVQVTRQFWATRWKTACCCPTCELPQPGPARQLRAWRRQRRLPASAATTRWRQSAVRGHGIHRRRRRVRAPAAADGRQAGFSDPVALNWAQDGTDIDFGSLSRAAHRLQRGNAAGPRCSVTRCATCASESDGSWTVTVRNRRTGEKRKMNAKFVFVGAGGDALPLLQKAGIDEAKGFGGFPVGGEFLRTDQPGADRGASCQGLRHAAGRRAADVGAASGRAGHQRQVVVVVRAIRGLVAEVLEARQGHRSAVVGQAQQPGGRCSASG